MKYFTISGDLCVKKNKVFSVLEQIKSGLKFSVYILVVIVCVSQEALL